MTRTFRRGMAAAGLIAIAAFTVIGCSSTSDGSGKATDSGTTQLSKAVTDAQALFAQYTKTQPAITIPPLKSKPPADKTIAILSCPTPGCQVSMKAAEDGAKKLGWTTKYFTSQLTPEDYQATWNRMLQASPDLIAYQAFLPNAVIQAQLAKAADLKIGIVSMVSTDPVDNVMRGVALSPADVGFDGKLLAAAVVSDAKGAAKTAYVTDPSFRLWDSLQKQYTEGVTGAGGSVDVVKVSLQNPTAIAGQVTSYLQSHPDVKYVVFPDASSVMLGVPQALKSAGITDVKIASVSPQASDLSELKAGDEWVSIATEVATSGYRLTDMLARIVEGMSFDPTPVGWHEILTKDNVTQTSQVPPTPGSPAAFFTAWHVS